MKLSRPDIAVPKAVVTGHTSHSKPILLLITHSEVSSPPPLFGGPAGPTQIHFSTGGSPSTTQTQVKPSLISPLVVHGCPSAGGAFRFEILTLSPYGVTEDMLVIHCSIGGCVDSVTQPVIYPVAGFCVMVDATTKSVPSSHSRLGFCDSKIMNCLVGAF